MNSAGTQMTHKSRTAHQAFFVQPITHWQPAYAEANVFDTEKDDQAVFFICVDVCACTD